VLGRNRRAIPDPGTLRQRGAGSARRRCAASPLRRCVSPGRAGASNIGQRYPCGHIFAAASAKVSGAEGCVAIDISRCAGGHGPWKIPLEKVRLRGRRRLARYGLVRLTNNVEEEAVSFQSAAVKVFGKLLPPVRGLAGTHCNGRRRMRQVCEYSCGC